MSDDKTRQGSQSDNSTDTLKNSYTYQKSDYKLPSDSLKDGDDTLGKPRSESEKSKK